jgi:hypothetical protein
MTDGGPGCRAGLDFVTSSARRIPGACWRPYGDASPFNRALPESPRLVSNSASIVTRAIGFGNALEWVGGQADTPDDYFHPIYFSDPSDPLYTVDCVRFACPEIEGKRIQIPGAARPAAGGDGHLAVIDREAHMEYDLFEVYDKPRNRGTIIVGSGGSTPIGTPKADGLGSNATAAHFGLAAGVIRPSELAAGEIDHALFLVVECTNGRAVWPAADNPGTVCSNRTNAPAMGQHFYLEISDAEIRELSLPDWQKAVLRAMANYGMFVGDTGGGGFAIQTESGSSYTSFGVPDPWVTLGRRYDLPTWVSSSTGTRRYLFDIKDAVDWDSRLRVADPCVARGTCE